MLVPNLLQLLRLEEDCALGKLRNLTLRSTSKKQDEEINRRLPLLCNSQTHFKLPCIIGHPLSSSNIIISYRNNIHVDITILRYYNMDIWYNMVYDVQ